MDVKTVYFSEPVTGLPKPVFYRLPKGLLCTEKLSPVAPRLLSVISCCFSAAVAHIPDARTTTTRNKGQWRIKAVGGRVNRCLCHHELITIVTPLSRPGSAKTAASVCL